MLGKKKKKQAERAQRETCRAKAMSVAARPKRKASREIDEHPETLKTCRRSAIGTRDRAIIGNRSALMDRYRGSFPLRSPLFLFFYPSLQMTWKNVEEDEEEAKKDEEEKEGEGEEVAEKRVLTTLPQNMVAITAGD